MNNSVESEKQEYIQEIESLQGQISRINSIIEDKNHKMAQQSSRISHLEDCIAYHESDLISKASDTEEVSRSNSKIRSENIALHDDLIKTRQVINELNMQISGLQINIDEERSRIKSLNNQIFCNESAIKDLQAMVSSKSVVTFV